MLMYGECECFVMQMLYVCVLCASCGSSQCCVLHALQFVKDAAYPRLSIMNDEITKATSDHKRRQWRQFVDSQQFHHF